LSKKEKKVYTSKSNLPSKKCPKNWLFLWLGGCTYTFSP